MSELRRARSRGSLGMGPRPASEGPPFEAISGSQARMHGDAVRSEQNQNGNRNEAEINGAAKDRGSTRATATEAVNNQCEEGDDAKSCRLLRSWPALVPRSERREMVGHTQCTSRVAWP